MTVPIKKQVKYALIGFGALFVVLAAIKGFQIYRGMTNVFAPPPEAITSVVTKLEPWPRTFSAMGSFAASQGVTLSAEQPGEVRAINFSSGDPIAKDSVLVELDTSVEEAQLKGAEALFEQAQLSLNRALVLRKKDAYSQAQLESEKAKVQETKAAVDSLRASILRKRIVAPFKGRAGIRMVNLGQYVNPGQGIVPLFALDPLYIDFALPQSSISVLKVGQAVDVTVNAFPGEIFKGTLTAINPQVNETTRNVELQATIDNPAERLRPGMFADVTVNLTEVDNYISVPASSVNYASYGDTVWVIEKMKSPDGKEYNGVRQQIIKVGPKRGDQVAILSGIEPGQEIVTSGGFKLRPGLAVAVNNTKTPSNDPAPNPADT